MQSDATGPLVTHSIAAKPKWVCQSDGPCIPMLFSLAVELSYCVGHVTNSAGARARYTCGVVLRIRGYAAALMFV